MFVTESLRLRLIVIRLIIDLYQKKTKDIKMIFCSIEQVTSNFKCVYVQTIGCSCSKFKKKKWKAFLQLSAILWRKRTDQILSLLAYANIKNTSRVLINKSQPVCPSQLKRNFMLTMWNEVTKEGAWRSTCLLIFNWFPWWTLNIAK